MCDDALPALGRRQPHTWSHVETCIFGKQSSGPGHCDPLSEMGRKCSWCGNTGYNSRTSAAAKTTTTRQLNIHSGGGLEIIGVQLDLLSSSSSSDSLVAASASTPPSSSTSSRKKEELRMREF
ncbi:hypothetical protein EV1_042302 [Malus domestica]